MNTIFNNSSSVTKQTSAKDETGSIDLKKRNAKQTLKSTKLDLNGKVLSTQEIETYLIEDKLYTETNGKWTRSMVLDPTKSFNERDKLKGLIELLNNSNIEVVGIEVIDGQRCYKLKVEPELNTVHSILAAQALVAHSSSPMPLPDVSFKDLSENDHLLYNSDVSYTVWVTVDKYIPKKIDAAINFALTPACLKVGSNKVPYFRVDATMTDTVVFSGFNIPDNMVVPSGAKNVMLNL